MSGWVQYQKMPQNTTHIAYVRENGEVYDPEIGWMPKGSSALLDHAVPLVALKELQQEDIDWVYGECVRAGESLWCLAHSSRFRELRGVQRCDDWQDFRLSVEAVIDRLKEER